MPLLSMSNQPSFFCMREMTVSIVEGRYYGFQTVCKCPFRALLVTRATDSNQTLAN